MKFNKNVQVKLGQLLKPSKVVTSLSKTLVHSEQIKDVVAGCAEELSSANVALKQELADQDQSLGVEKALEISEEVEIKVLDAVKQLTAVNNALVGEIVERERLEHQLASVKVQEQSARHAAFHDPLTGLPNRVFFNDRLEYGLTQANRHGWNLAVMFVDLDKFKNINDRYGHDAGDAVLQTISQRLQETTRVDDTVSRHGGDEFLYLLMEINNIRDATLVAKKIIKAIQKPCNIGTCDLVIRASIGISIFPKNGKSADDLIKSADKAMYQAKRLKSGYAIAH
ncbi:GGDEF domain-containing protein [Candidatus Nitrotoga arctica]|uniref:Diguanylate cyclase (GGDEF) domain-containing protein n=1 Tax=Candidatus Nitrotoga arctica TaxID=453162 RepID=A0ABM8YZR2_9PROT|nr:GGDEF domain-containing protein [Candidatus Nitrotoga arctica]CAG9933073.1 Diguanylate cyclase (GGDEF) domain-containing protein [Candidatus Nitrotoga arctica]